MSALPSYIPDPWQRIADSWDPPTRDPDVWAREIGGVALWSKQSEVLRSVDEHRRTAVHSAHNVGKSFVASVTATWWIDTHLPGTAFVVTTAPTASQVKAILWREIRRRHKTAGLQGRTNLTEWWIDEELVAFGRKPADWDPDAFQGIHAEFVLFIIDEATGVPDSIWEAGDSLISNEGSRMLAIGNPTNPYSRFAKVCRPGSGWNVVHIDGYESPNFTEEKEQLPEAVQNSLLSPVWVEEKRAEWGEGSPLFIARVRGQFPPEDAEFKVMPWHLILNARPFPDAPLEEVLGAYDEDELTPIELGVDIGASQGGDETVVYERRGVVAARVWRIQSADPEKVSGHIVRVAREAGASKVKIDSIGVGFGIVGSVRKSLRPDGVKVIGVNVAESSSQKKKFKKLRDQFWWTGRDRSAEELWDLSSVDDKTLNELNSPMYEIDGNGRVVVEKKSETKKRLGHSPDSADALLMAFINPPTERPKPRARSSRR